MNGEVITSAASDIISGGALHKKSGSKSVDAAAEDFEAMFMTQMMQPMFAGVETDGMFSGGSAEETWRSLLLNEYGKISAHCGSLGIAAAVKSELLKAQEHAA